MTFNNQNMLEEYMM